MNGCAGVTTWLDTGWIVSLRGVPAAVVTVTVAAVSPLLKPTIVSRLVDRSIRETTSTAPFAYRTTDAPVASSGWASRSADSVFECASIGFCVTSNEVPFPIGGPPTRACVCQSVTWVGNMSCRACWSPPEPIIPTSSPYQHRPVPHGAGTEGRSRADVLEQRLGESPARRSRSAARPAPCRGCRGRW